GGEWLAYPADRRVAAQFGICCQHVIDAQFDLGEVYVRIVAQHQFGTGRVRKFEPNQRPGSAVRAWSLDDPTPLQPQRDVEGLGCDYVLGGNADTVDLSDHGSPDRTARSNQDRQSP